MDNKQLSQHLSQIQQELKEELGTLQQTIQLSIGEEIRKRDVEKTKNIYEDINNLLKK